MSSNNKYEKKLAVIFPGIGYNRDKPLLYYSAKAANANGYEIMYVEYGELPKKVKGNEEKMRKAYAIAMERVMEQLEGIDRSEYKSFLFISKSIGTAIAATADRKLGFKADHVYYTPVEASFEAIDKRGMIFHGTADDWARTEIIKSECEKREMPLYIIENANHSLETGDITADIQNLEYIMDITQKYISSCSDSTDKMN